MTRVDELLAVFPRDRFPAIKVRILEDGLTSALKARLDRPIPGGCAPDGLTYAQAIASADGGGAFLLIKGGIVRDLLYEGASAQMRDVDVSYHGMDVQELRRRIVAGTGDRCRNVAVSPGLGYLVIGTDPDDRLEAMRLKPEECYSDGRCNSLFLDVQSGLLIDPTGSGEEDARAHVWQIPCENHELWLRSTRIALWRMLKFQTASRPYTVPDSTAVVVYRAWYHDRDAISEAQWRNVTFRHIDPTRVAEVLRFMIQEVDRLHKAGALTFSGAAMALVLVQKGVLVPYLPAANIAAKKKKATHKMHKRR